MKVNFWLSIEVDNGISRLEVPIHGILIQQFVDPDIADVAEEALAHDPDANYTIEEIAEAILAKMKETE